MLKVRSALGFTLIEALVAIAIMVAGLAGSAAMLLKTVVQERESGNRRAAIRIAASLAEHLRAIRRPDGRPVLAITGVEPATACAGDASSCAPESAAEQLRSAWEAEATFVLPRGAAVSVAVPDPLLPEYLISINWPAVGGGTEQLRLPVTT